MCWDLILIKVHICIFKHIFYFYFLKIKPIKKLKYSIMGTSISFTSSPFNILSTFVFFHHEIFRMQTSCHLAYKHFHLLRYKTFPYEAILYPKIKYIIHVQISPIPPQIFFLYHYFFFYDMIKDHPLHLVIRSL